MGAWDRQLEEWIAGNRVHAFDPFVKALTFSATYGIVWLVLAAVAAVLMRRPALFGVVLLADGVAELSTDAIKAVTDRSRPVVDTIVATPSSSSFPSGHAATSFACAIVVAAFLPRLRGAVFALAALVALSRLYVGVHFPTDVVAGAAWGAVVGASVLALVRRRDVAVG
ncbi:MAG: phosphatase PAP2 family protein [Actinobacteria bacterium]|uniref:Unannotated protein n=1 Tax=freshwater metagenome TaxID=449393 RepID=A0A6J6PNF9_9ZZZZ|nr:phosphatase PAP2 family protein [Actinomycetota bacterium]